MVTIGMLHYRRDPRKVFRTYAYAAAAKMEGVQFFYFTPARVDMDRNTIKGLFYEKGTWIERETPLPDVLFNAGVGDGERTDAVVDYLYERIPYTSHPIGDKITVYQKLMQGKLFADYLLPTCMIERAEDVQDLLRKHGRIVLKPSSGHKGIGVTYVEQTADGYQVIALNQERQLSEREWRKEVKEMLAAGDWIGQPYLNSRTHAGQPYDFRLHVQKNGRGEWVVTTIYPRIGQPGSIITNLSSGGFTAVLKDFLLFEFGPEAFDIQRYLERFAVMLAAHMDKAYAESFDELGIDVGLDDKRKIWLYEVNWRPGAPVRFYMEMDQAINTIQYARYLAENSRKSAGE